MPFRNIAAAAAAMALVAAGQASAAVTMLTFTGANAPDAGAQIYFNGLDGNTSTVLPGLSATLDLTLLSVTGGGYDWNFSYLLSNTSTEASKIALMGWDVSSDYQSVTGVSGLFTNAASGAMSFAGDKDLCLKVSNGGGCAGGGNGGLDSGASGAGVFTLHFAGQELVGYQTIPDPNNSKKTIQVPVYSSIAAPTALTFDDFAIRYHSSYASTVGVPDAPQAPVLEPQAVPEPETWAMLILGFFGLGAILRHRRAALRTA